MAGCDAADDVRECPLLDWTGAICAGLAGGDPTTLRFRLRAARLETELMLPFERRGPDPMARGTDSARVEKKGVSISPTAGRRAISAW